MSERTPSRDLKPGDQVIWTGIRRKGDPVDRESVLDRRKENDDGWWIAGGGGLADTVLDDPRNKWVIAS